MSAVAAGIIGGVIALLGAGGLQFAGLLPSPVRPSRCQPAMARLLRRSRPRSRR